MEADRLDRYGSLCSKYALPPVRMMVVFVTAPFQSSLFPVADNTQELSLTLAGKVTWIFGTIE